jgi:hypothetical protein
MPVVRKTVVARFHVDIDTDVVEDGDADEAVIAARRALWYLEMPEGITIDTIDYPEV